MTETRALLGDIYDAWREQDLDRLATYLPNDFCHTINFPPEIHPAGGTYQGKQAVLARWEQIFSEYDFVKFDASSLMVEGEHAAAEVPVSCRHRETGASMETVKAHFWTFEAGWPVRLNEYYDLGDVQAFADAISEPEPA